MFSIHRTLFLALQKVRIIKITPPQFLTTQWKISPMQNFWFLPQPLLLSGKPWGHWPKYIMSQHIILQCIFEGLKYLVDLHRYLFSGMLKIKGGWSNLLKCIISQNKKPNVTGSCLKILEATESHRHVKILYLLSQGLMAL